MISLYRGSLNRGSTIYQISNLVPRLGGRKQNKLIIHAVISFAPPNISKMACCYMKGFEGGRGGVGHFSQLWIGHDFFQICSPYNFRLLGSVFLLHAFLLQFFFCILLILWVCPSSNLSLKLMKSLASEHFEGKRKFSSISPLMHLPSHLTF